LVFTREERHALLDGFPEGLVLDEDVVAGTNQEEAEDRLKLLELGFSQGRDQLIQLSITHTFPC
jgi:hypothetical protein